MDSTDDKKFNITCEDCNFSFAEMEPYEQHLRGKQHMKRSKKKQRLSQRRPMSDDDPVGIYSNTFTVANHDRAPHGELLKKRAQSANSIEEIENKERPQGKKKLDGSHVEHLVCEVCDNTFTELIQYKLHVSSKSHNRAVKLKKLKGLTDLISGRQSLHGEKSTGDVARREHHFCTVCEKQYELEGYFKHVGGKCHKKRVCLQKIFDRIKAELTDSEDEDQSGGTESHGSETTLRVSGRQRCGSNSFSSISGDFFECKYCNKVFTEAIAFALHLADKPHAKEKRKNSLVTELKDLLAEESEECGFSSDVLEDGNK